MKILRTPLLQKAPEIPASGRRDVIKQRLVLILILFSLPTLWIVLMRKHVLADQGLGWISYRLHDYVYLPLKGVLFNRPFPSSLVGWLLIVGVLIAVISSFLLDRSFLLKPHRFLLRALYTSPNRLGETLVLGGTSWLRRLGFSSSLLRRALRNEWLIAGNVLLREPGGRPAADRKSAGRRLHFARLTSWMAQVEALFPQVDPLAQLSDWHWSYTLIKIQAARAETPAPAGQNGQESNSDPAKKQARQLKESDPAIAQILQPVGIVLGDFHTLNDAWLEQAAPEDELFSIEAIGRDLCRLLYLDLQAVYPDQPLPAPFGGLRERPPSEQKALRVQSAAAVDRRRFRLQGAAQQIHQAFLDPAAQSRLHALDLLPAAPQSWQLALSTALHAALQADNARLGSAFFEAQDAAILAIGLGFSRKTPGWERWIPLVTGFPRQDHYAAAAAVRLIGLGPEEAALERLSKWDHDLIAPADLSGARFGWQSLHHASGPAGPVGRERNGR